jgi:hypothetical protein
MNPRKLPRILILTAGYALLLQACVVVALLLRFGGAVPPEAWSGYRAIALPFTALSLLGFLAAGLYHGSWRYAGTASLLQVLQGVSLSAAALMVLGWLSPGNAAVVVEPDRAGLAARAGEPGWRAPRLAADARGFAGRDT